jgi:hypothetical protein
MGTTPPPSHAGLDANAPSGPDPESAEDTWYSTEAMALLPKKGKSTPLANLPRTDGGF